VFLCGILRRKNLTQDCFDAQQKRSPRGLGDLFGRLLVPMHDADRRGPAAWTLLRFRVGRGSLLARGLLWSDVDKRALPPEFLYLLVAFDKEAL